MRISKLCSVTPSRTKAGVRKTPGRPARPGQSDGVDPVEVVCRLRPVPEGEERCVEQLDDTTVLVTPPANSQAFRYGTAKEQQYKFGTVFPDTATQKQLFDAVAKPLVRDLLNGKNGLLFAYGITGSGKTHTMMGSQQDGGIMPRCIDVIFNSIVNYQARRFVFKPDRLNSFDVQTEADAMLDRQREILNTPKPGKTPRKRRVPPTPGGAGGGGGSGSVTPDESDAASTRVPEVSQVSGLDEDNAFAVFVSYVEIYNNYVYDLLEEVAPENMKKSLQSRMLREDNNKNIYVHGASEVEVSTPSEALDALRRGQRRRKVAHTTLNTESSRSHSVFTIRVVQAPLDPRGEEVLDDKALMVVGQLSLVDLAGSERTNRTKNNGDRLREAGNINNSLMVLRTCIETLRENQLNDANKMVPYRDSRITHLFKNYFDGEGKVKMVVCVNPRAEEYDETIHVMKFAELTQEVVVARPADRPLDMGIGLTPGRRKANQILREAQRRLGSDGRPSEAEPSGGEAAAELAPVFCLGPVWPSMAMTPGEEEETVRCLVRFLERRVQLRATLLHELQRQQDAFRQLLVKTEMEMSALRQENAQLRASSDGSSRRTAALEARLASAEAANDSLNRRFRELNENQAALVNELGEKEMLLNQEALERERVKQRMKTRMQQEKERLASDMKSRIKMNREMLKTEMRAKDEKLRALRDIINNEEAGFAVPSAPPTPAPRPRPSTANETATFRPSRSDPRLSGTPQPKRTVAATTRHRRSKSTDAEVWLDHRPGHVLELATIFQPKMKKRKSVTKLDAKDVINDKTSKYVLTHQDQDSQGEVETHMVKGDVLPTVGGGRAVVFNDMETLRLSNPGAKRPSDELGPGLDYELARERCATGIEGHAAGKRRKT
ncbi:kinesin-like protein KIF23 isoform X1 [Amphibalanus amphitrite]|uniref:kinesin-like protein KIF23 isoform X1 n=1 Tax=Amphibalanus amphitrite TaxID=1232801 RepID=UPI001C90F537|nr:kinesin-like protein KIF23 isoform X1 [Amphibalanus amphitrite]XP_043237419.1 kinesin-like protein KIF23 isoform X1 [Amphibalanus amphitrite]